MEISEYKIRLDADRYPYIAEAMQYSTDGEKLTLKNPKAIAMFMGDQVGLKHEAVEFFYALAFDQKNRLTGMFKISEGTINNTLVSPREVFQRLLMLGAVYWVAVHNHPSGDSTPSEIDMDLIKKLSDASKMLCLPLMDHIIIGDNWLSFREQDLLEV